jgi:hypothetical protein
LHGLARGGHDTDAIDDAGWHDAHAPRERVLADEPKQVHAAPASELFGVAHSRKVRTEVRVIKREDNRGGNDRPCPRSPPGFIDARYGAKPLSPQGRLKDQVRDDVPIRQRRGLALLLESGGFPLALPQEVELRPAHVAMAQHFYLLDARRVRGKRPFDTDAVGCDAPDCKLGVGSSATTNANDRTPDELDALTVPFNDSKVHLHVITHAQVGTIGL